MKGEIGGQELDEKMQKKDGGKVGKKHLVQELKSVSDVQKNKNWRWKGKENAHVVRYTLEKQASLYWSFV